MLGLVMGGTTSGLQSLQGRVRGMRDQEVAQKAEASGKEVQREGPSVPAEAVVSLVKEDDAEEEKLARRSKLERLLSPEQMAFEPPKSMWSGIKSWIPGLRAKGDA